MRYLTTLAENEQQLKNIRAGLELKLKSRRAALEEADRAEQQLNRELDAARQRLSVLRELEKNMEGYQNSVKTVMRAASARRLRGIIGPVSSILRVEPGREVAIETALGGALQNIVVENEAAAKAGIALLRSENAGRATFLPLDTVQPVCSGENCPARQGWQAVWSRPMHGTATSCPICWAASSWWTISTRPPVWPGTTVSAARSSRWMVRWSMRAQLYRRQCPAQRGLVHPQAGAGGAAGQGCEIAEGVPCRSGKDRPVQTAGRCSERRADRRQQ